MNDGQWVVSNGGGTRPVWGRNGQELFYLDLTNRLTAVPVDTHGQTFTYGTPARMLDTTYAGPTNNSRPYDVSPDAQRFLMIKHITAGADLAGARLAVIVNWVNELTTRLPRR